jgi:hypothetical protein
MITKWLAICLDLESKKAQGHSFLDQHRYLNISEKVNIQNRDLLWTAGLHSDSQAYLFTLYKLYSSLNGPRKGS